METLEPKSGLSITAAKLSNHVQSLYDAKHISLNEFKTFRQLFADLSEIHDSLEFYDNHPLYLLLHRELHRLFKQPIPVYSFMIKINLRPGNHVPALLTFDLFPKEPIPDYTPNNFG